jgi:hypothetical protein
VNSEETLALISFVRKKKADSVQKLKKVVLRHQNKEIDEITFLEKIKRENEMIRELEKSAEVLQNEIKD